jgi:hypothetical protein
MPSANGFDPSAGLVGVEYENLDSTCIGVRSIDLPIYRSVSIGPAKQAGRSADLRSAAQTG